MGDLERKWRNGEGVFGITNVHFNFYFFYHKQSLANVWIFSLPLILMCNNPEPTLYKSEIVGIVFWFISFSLENVADNQFSSFKIKNRGNKNSVMDQGLWRYSRHPNYFFEWMIWNSYSLMTFFSINVTWQYLILLLIYRRYQEKTNIFFPFP